MLNAKTPRHCTRYTPNLVTLEVLHVLAAQPLCMGLSAAARSVLARRSERRTQTVGRFERCSGVVVDVDVVVVVVVVVTRTRGRQRYEFNSGLIN